MVIKVKFISCGFVVCVRIACRMLLHVKFNRQLINDIEAFETMWILNTRQIHDRAQCLSFFPLYGLYLYTCNPYNKAQSIFCPIISFVTIVFMRTKTLLYDVCMLFSNDDKITMHRNPLHIINVKYSYFLIPCYMIRFNINNVG